MSTKITRNHNLRREIAEFVLECSMDELLALVCAIETEPKLPKFFGCDKCKSLFGECPNELTTEPCKNRILKYEEMRDSR